MNNKQIKEQRFKRGGNRTIHLGMWREKGGPGKENGMSKGPVARRNLLLGQRNKGWLKGEDSEEDR